MSTMGTVMMGVGKLLGKLIKPLGKLMVGDYTNIVNGVVDSINKKPEKSVKALRKSIKKLNRLIGIGIRFKKAGLWIDKHIFRKKLPKSELAKINRLINANEDIKKMNKELKKFQKSDWANKLLAKNANFIGELYQEYRSGGAGRVAAKIIATGLTKIVSMFSPPPIQLAPTLPMPSKVSADTTKINTRSMNKSVMDTYKVTSKGVEDVKSLASKMTDPLLSGAMVALATSTASGIQSLASQSASNTMELAEGTNAIAGDLAEKVASSANLNTTNSGIIMSTQDRLLTAANSLAPPITDTANRVATVTPIIGELPRHLQTNSVVTLNAIDELGERLGAGTASLNDKFYVPVMEATAGGGIVSGIVSTLLPTITKMGEEIIKKEEEQGEEVKTVKASFGDYLLSVKDSVKSKVELAKERAAQLHSTLKEYVGNIGFLLGAVYRAFHELPFVKNIMTAVTKLLKHFNLIGQDRGFQAEAMNKEDYEASLRKSNSADNYRERVTHSARAVEMARSHMNYEIDELNQRLNNIDKNSNRPEWERVKNKLDIAKNKRQMMTDLIDKSDVFKVLIEPFKIRENERDKSPLRIFDHTDEMIIYNYFFIPFIKYVRSHPRSTPKTTEAINVLGISENREIDVATFVNGIFKFESDSNLINNAGSDVLKEFNIYVRDSYGAITKNDITYITNLIYQKVNGI